MEDLPLDPHVLEQRDSELRFEVHDAADHQEYGIHIVQRSVVDDPLLHDRRDCSVWVLRYLGSFQVEDADHRRSTALRCHCLQHLVCQSRRYQEQHPRLLFRYLFGMFWVSFKSGVHE